jgi:hypothetical protein
MSAMTAHAAWSDDVGNEATRPAMSELHFRPPLWPPFQTEATLNVGRFDKRQNPSKSFTVTAFTGFTFKTRGMSGWLLVGVMIALSGLWPLWRFARTKHNPHACRICGYDLRASPERCPECGTDTTPATPP